MFKASAKKNSRLRRKFKPSLILLLAQLLQKVQIWG